VYVDEFALVGVFLFGLYLFIEFILSGNHDDD
jgi:hypothetical protein